MKDFESLVSFRKKVLAGYSILGIIVSLAVLFFITQGSGGALSGLTVTIVYAIIATFIWVGGVVARSIGDVDDGFEPVRHWRAIARGLLWGLPAIAVVVAISWLLTQCPLPILAMIPVIVFSSFIGFLVTSAPTRQQD